MPRKSIALFLATTGLISALAGCGPGREAGEKGEENAGPNGPSKVERGNSTRDGTNPQGENAGTKAKSNDEGGEGGEGGKKDEDGKKNEGGKKDEGGEGGEGGEG